MRFLLAALPLLALFGPASAAQVDDAAAVALAQPQELVVDGSLSLAAVSALLKPVDAFYGFWNKGSGALLGDTERDISTILDRIAATGWRAAGERVVAGTSERGNERGDDGGIR